MQEERLDAQLKIDIFHFYCVHPVCFNDTVFGQDPVPLRFYISCTKSLSLLCLLIEGHPDKEKTNPNYSWVTNKLGHCVLTVMQRPHGCDSRRLRAFGQNPYFVKVAVTLQQAEFIIKYQDLFQTIFAMMFIFSGNNIKFDLTDQLKNIIFTKTIGDQANSVSV